MKLIYSLLLMATSICPSLLGQQNAAQELAQISALEQRGRFNEVIEPVSRLISSNTLTQAELGRACLLLGTAYQQHSDFMLAQNAYEKAIHILSASQANAEDYAAALDNFAN